MFKAIPTGHAQADAIAAEHGATIAAEKTTVKQLMERFGCSDWCARKVRVAVGLSVVDPSIARRKWREARKGGRTQGERKELKEVKEAGDGNDAKGTSYELDAFNACYVFTFPKSKHVSPLKLPKKAVDALLMDYSNHGGKMTAREVATAWSLPRWQAVAIIRALGFVKSGVPFSDERLSEVAHNLADGAADALHRQWVAALSQQTEAKVERSLDVQIRRDAMRWREQDASVLTWAGEACQGLRSAIEAWKPSERLTDVSEADSDGCTLVISVTDLHVGMGNGLTGSPWAGAVGERFDLETCKHRLTSALDSLVSRVPAGMNVKGIVFALTGDILHSDTFNGATTKGTTQSMACEPAQAVRYAWKLIPTVIMSMAEYAPVEVVCIEGNHDSILAHALVATLGVAFADSDRITVHMDSAEPYQVVEVDNTMIMVGHGHALWKPADLGALMARRWPQMWGRTRHRVCLTGHRHAQQTIESHGVTVHVMPSLVPGDQYHRNFWAHGYRPQIKALCVHSVDGVVSHLFGHPAIEDHVWTV